jgi:hypothetical protein
VNVEYYERLNGAKIQVSLPETRDDAFDLLATIENAATTDPARWKALVRMYSASDLYMLGLFTSCALRLNPYTSRPEIDCDFLFNYAREIQFNCDSVVDFSAREHWKSTLKTYLNAIRAVLVDPNISIGIFSHELISAQKHLIRIREELQQNQILMAAWPDVLWTDIQEIDRSYSIKDGLTFKGRTIVGISPNIAAYTFMLKLPTGVRLGVIILDDVETEKTVETVDALEKSISRFRSVLNLRGRGARIWINGTYHSPNGIIATLLNEGWPGRCHKAEDVTKPAPDIAAIYDAAEGKDPASKAPIPAPVRNAVLAGEPIFLTPLECAMKRWSQGDANYNMQNMGDPFAGQQKRLLVEWIRYYEKDPFEWGRDKNIYILVDPSRGMGDPTFAVVLAAGKDRTLSWVDGIKKRLSPSEFERALYVLASRWSTLGSLQQIRIEEFAGAQYGTSLRKYFDSFNFHGCPIVACGVNMDKRLREWQRLEPAFRKILFPRAGIRAEDERGIPFDLSRYWIDYEYSKFPLPLTDDGLAAWSLAWEPSDKVGDIVYDPPAEAWDEEELQKPMSKGSWMSEGW